MTELESIELGRQLKKPSGDIGKLIGENMNIANSAIYSLIFDMINFKNNDTVLEIGFGNGKFFSRYFEINPKLKVFGIDYSDTMCDEATWINQRYIDKNQLHLICENALKTSFENNYFDKIITLNTIYFWSPLEKQLEEIIRVLKKGGELIIGFGPRSVMEKLEFTKEVFTLFEPLEVVELLKKYKFDILKKEIQNIRKKSIEGKDIDSTNICLVAKNCKS
jgi:ubiquinone/menaquinone biosynthesis C-methylase UbiE